MGSLALAVAIVVAVVIAGTSSAAGRTGPTVPVILCPTTIAPGRERPKPPARLTVLHDPATTRGLVAYTNADIFLIGPAGMHCAGGIGEDATTALAIGPRALTRELNEPGTTYTGSGLTLSFDPDCSACEAGDACPFFPQLARTFGLPPCTTAIPPGEQIDKLTPQLTLFEDPPGLRGDGWPSGGPDPANGVVGFTGNPAKDNTTVYRSTCTLPASEHWICTVSLNDVLSRYG